MNCTWEAKFFFNSFKDRAGIVFLVSTLLILRFTNIRTKFLHHSSPPPKKKSNFLPETSLSKIQNMRGRKRNL